MDVYGEQREREPNPLTAERALCGEAPGKNTWAGIWPGRTSVKQLL